MIQSIQVVLKGVFPLSKRKHKQKKKGSSLMVPLLFIIITGSIGWYFTKTIEGSIYTVILFFLLLIIFKIWRKTTWPSQVLEKRALSKLITCQVKNLNNT